MFVSKIFKIVFKIWEILEKIKTEVDGLLLVLLMKKSSLSTSVFIFSAIFQILKIKFYVVLIQTSRNLKSIKFATRKKIV